MAERRMFARSIIESDAFLDMPAEAQMLYVHLNMASDDDGFCDNPRSIMRTCGASNDSMRLLMAKKFVLTFDKNDGFIVVIKHWRMNNYIRKDTYRETKYKEFMREMYYDENQSYSMNPDDGHKPCISAGLPKPVTNTSRTRNEPVTNPSLERDESLTQDRIVKDSIVKFSKGEDKEEECEREPEAGHTIIDPEKESKADRIRYWKKRVDFMKNAGFDSECIYTLANADGITAEEIDSFKEDEQHEQE